MRPVNSALGAGSNYPWAWASTLALVADPAVHSKSLQDLHDRERLAEAVRLATQLLHHEAFPGYYCGMPGAD